MPRYSRQVVGPSCLSAASGTQCKGKRGCGGVGGTHDGEGSRAGSTSPGIQSLSFLPSFFYHPHIPLLSIHRIFYLLVITIANEKALKCKPSANCSTAH